MESASQKTGWLEHFASGAAYAFVFNPQAGDRLLAGAMCPSNDAAQRAFPFVVAAEIRAETLRIHATETVPLSLEAIWQRTHHVVLDAVHRGSLERGALSTSAIAELPDFEGAISNYEEWTAALQLAEFEILLFDAANGRLAPTVREVLSAVLPHRGVHPPRTQLSLRLPLGRCGGAATCFWLAVARRAAAWHGFIPSFFWRHAEDGGDLLLHLGRPPTATLQLLWNPSCGADEVYDLTPPRELERSTSPKGGPPRLVEAMDAVLANPVATLRDLLIGLDVE
jgi:type VI secretion system ImpM family protein